MPLAPPILVTGSHRSGTTWVGRVLAAAPGVGYVSEPFRPDHRPGIHVRPRRRTGSPIPRAGNAVSACRSDPTLVWFDKHVPVLAYGATWAGFGTTCLSQASGLTCVNAKGRGFFLSRERWSIF